MGLTPYHAEHDVVKNASLLMRTVVDADGVLVQ